MKMQTMPSRRAGRGLRLAAWAASVGLFGSAQAAGLPSLGLTVAGTTVPVEFILFGLTLLGVALLHRWTLAVALTGMSSISLYKIFWAGFKTGPGWAGWLGQLQHEALTLSNLLLLLLGFTLLARHFEKSRLPVILPRYLPDDWKGCFSLLVLVFFISSFLDNIAAAMIGGAMAHQLFRSRVHIGFLAAIVAASNAGGAWSVVGDTTTTMIWLAGHSPLDVLHAFVGSAVALLVFGVIAAKQQQAYSPILKHAHEHTRVDGPRLVIVGLMLGLAVLSNVLLNLHVLPQLAAWPLIGLSVWAVLLLTMFWRRPDWEVLGESSKGTLFLLALVFSASMMPVESLPSPSWPSALGLGFLSAVFDNIPLTALALKQGGYDWGFLAYAVGFGGSMLWFGSSAGVALTNLYPEGKSAAQWLRQGWHVALAYVLGFAAMVLLLGWTPFEK